MSEKNLGHGVEKGISLDVSRKTFWRTSGSLLSLRNLIMRTKSGRTVTENWELKCMEERNNPTAQPWVEDKAVL